MNDNALLDLVEKEIAARDKNDGVRYHVNRSKVWREGNWSYIIVVPEPQDIWASEYAKFMSEVEESIEKQFGTRLLLVPDMPD